MVVNSFMELSILRLLSSPFNDYFYGDPMVLKVDSLKQPPLPYNFLYNDCSFSNMVSRPVTYHSDGEMQIMFENCLFYNCTSNNQQAGGAFYIYIPNGGCIFRKLCASSCQADSSYQLGYVYTHTDNQNSFIFSSFEKCSIDKASQSYSLSLQRGMQTINNMNSSKNTGYQYNGFYSSSYNLLLFSFCSVTDINSTYRYSIYFSGNIGSVKNSNFVNLRSPLSNSWTVYLGGSIIMEYCIYKSWESFAIYGTSNVIVRNCYFDSSLNQTTGSFAFQNPYGNTDTYILEHFSTAMCIAQNPAYPQQTLCPSATPFNQNPENVCQTLPPPPTPAQTIPQDNTLSGVSLTSLGSIMRIFAVSITQILFF